MTRQESAETLALQALTWMAQDDEIFNAFLGASGASGAQVAAQAADPAFLASVLDFLLLEDRWIMAFSDAHGLRYEAPMRARMALPGGAVDSWT